MDIETTMEDQEEQAIIKYKKKRVKLISCKNPDCDYETDKKRGPHICLKCGWIADVIRYR